MKMPLGSIIVFGCALTQSVAHAEVSNSGPNGFTVKITTAINAVPAEVYQRFIHNVGDWWNPEHTFSGDAHNLSFEERPMGCFCEKLPDKGGVRHLEIVYIAPGKMLRLSGGLGPLQEMAVSGSMTINFTPAGLGTKLEVTYAVGGYLPGGLDSLSKPVDGMLTEQFTRLKKYIEGGASAPASPANVSVGVR